MNINYLAGTPLYQQDTSHLDGFATYRLFDVVVRLEVCVRQDLITNDLDQMKFIELLPRIRNAQNDEKTVEDWKFLLKNEYTIEKAKHFEGTHAIIMVFILDRCCPQRCITSK